MEQRIESSSQPLTPSGVVTPFQDQKPKLRNGFDALSLIFHLVMKNSGFKFLGCGDDYNVENANKDELAPEGWNKSDDAYSFKYKHPRSSMTYVIKSLVMGQKLLVHGLGLEDGTIHNIEISVNDYVKQGAKMDDYDNLFKDLDRLILTFKTGIVNKIFPEGTKEGYEHSPSTINVQRSQPSPNNIPYDPYNDPLRVPERHPRQPVSPLMEGGPYYPPFVSPFAIGGGDLNPFQGPYVPFPGTTPGNLVGPNHPGFQPRSPQFGRGRGFIPPPPGARFDPFGPGNMGEPDRDDFPPPGVNYDHFL